jgi:tetratricopeptide (TPR) repeat protein
VKLCGPGDSRKIELLRRLSYYSQLGNSRSRIIPIDLESNSYSKDLLEPVEATWRISFGKLRDENPAALDLLRLIAYLAPDNIPRNLLQSTAANPLAFNKSVEALRRYSLIETGEDTVSVHRLVQEVTRNGLEESERRRWAEAAVELVNNDFPSDSDDYRNWSICSRLLAHAIEATKYAEELAVGLDPAFRLLNRAGLYEKQRAQLESAEQLIRRSLEIDEKIYGPDHASVASVYGNLGQIIADRGDLEGALQFARRALETEEKVYGADHPKIATAVNNLGTILKEKGDLEGALQYTRRALELTENTSGANNPAIAVYANNLGMFLKDKGDLDEALQYMLRALEIGEKAYGPDHPNVARHANNLGLILKAQGDLDGALAYMRRALRILESTYGSDHPHTKKAARNLQLLEADLARRKGAASTG